MGWRLGLWGAVWYGLLEGERLEREAGGLWRGRRGIDLSGGGRKMDLNSIVIWLAV